ncbi:glycine/betaine ABC transporter [Clostridium sp. W14A]|uniref:Glycine betaine ABC transporter substrate-binding protein n=1 Tax=Caproicibacter fermentans TaxID=2576756 RepID=A0A7G8T752_9FIRM|nr:glycine betaine ABC transporter substrate-binding protein [Caproicibacter fermentans]OCN01642.1 glycine/betaine ABC transporter [Clostridium sp. W14A]QNK39443.1 glycine betaine ABC transporter substrate-binding protein [Caproicibacter fermentans]
MKKSITAAILAGAICLGMLAGCAQNGESSSAASQTGSAKNGGTKPEIQIGYVNWSEDIAMTNLMSAILKDKMGYDTKQVQTDVAPVFASLASGGTDVFLDCWLPVTHKSYMDKYGSEVKDYGVSFDNAKIGLVVPSYVDIDSIDQLNANKDKFDGTIVGIDSGAGIMTTTDKALEDYGLDYKLMPGSGPTMTAALKKAVDNEEPIVVTGWQPHWMFAKWDLKFLKDPKGTYGEAESIHKLGSKKLDEKAPDVAKFLTNFKMTSDQLGDLMGAVADADDPLEAARSWMNSNEDLVSGWLPAKS